MSLPKKERVVFSFLLLLAVSYGAFITLKILTDNAVMLVPKDQVEIVETCKDNEVACSLIYTSKDEVPDQ